MNISLKEFLLARIAEDKSVELAASMYKGNIHVDNMKGWRDVAAHKNRFTPARGLAEVAAKRAVLDIHEPDAESPDHTGATWERDSAWVMRTPCTGCPNDYDRGLLTPIDECPTLRALAAVYSDHPDFNDSWTVAS